MLKLDKNKLAGLKTFDDHLQERYGDENSPERKEFEAKAKAWYYAERLPFFRSTPVKNTPTRMQE